MKKSGFIRYYLAGDKDYALTGTVKQNVLLSLFALLLVLGVVLTIDINILSPRNGDLKIKTDSVIGLVDQKYLSIAIDTGFLQEWESRNFSNNKALLLMMKSLSPAYFRVGGNAADQLLFYNEESGDLNKRKHVSSKNVLPENFSENVFSGNAISEGFNSENVSYLSGNSWLALNRQVARANLSLLFDLNALLRKPTGEWDSSNAKQLIEFSQKNNLNIDWQLGNEPNSFLHKFNRSVSPKQLADDFKILSNLLSNTSKFKHSLLVGPDVTNPRVGTDIEVSSIHYLAEFLKEASHEVPLSAVTWHQYYLNGRNTTEEAFLNTSVYNQLSKEIKKIKNVVSRNKDKTIPIWISETSSAYGGGAPGLSDTFVGSFIWVDKLGLAATFNISVVVRQTLLGSNYGLIDSESLLPNPDFWVSLLHKKLVGRRVLRLDIKKRNPNVRLYAHCPTKAAAGNRLRPNTVVIFGINVGDTHYKSTLSAYDNTSSWVFDLELYIITSSRDDSLKTKTILLNGKPLQLSPSGEIPSLKPEYRTDKVLVIPPRSVAFIVVHGIFAPACGLNR